MKTVTIIVPEGHSNLASIQGPYDIFSKVNKYIEARGGKPVFRLLLTGISKEVKLAEGAFSIRCDINFAEVTQTDLIIIPALDRNVAVSLELNKPLVTWIAQQYKEGAEVASICSGAFLLASTGLLKGKKCSTHWLVADAFRKMFPDVNLVQERMITDEQGLYSSGGAYSFLNLILYLVEKYCGRETAIYCSKLFVIDIDRYCQSPFSIFSGQKDHEDETVKKAQFFIENNIHQKITVDRLASMFALSKRNFERRFKKATSNTPVEYLQRVKIEAAKKKFESGRETINDVMHAVGYSDKRAFRVIFKKVTGLSPFEYRGKYTRTTAN